MLNEATGTTLASVKINRYISHIHLRYNYSEAEIMDYYQELSDFIKSVALAPLDKVNLDRLFLYRVPGIKPDGCSRIDGVLQEEPYDLRITLGIDPIKDLAKQPETRQVFILDQLVEKVIRDIGVHWLGYYQTRKVTPTTEALVKLAYRGVESRAEFPLTKEFAKLSNNSTVGLSGKAVLINDIERYLWENSGPYYQCDSKVHSEACFPVFNDEGDKVVGVIDAECWERNKFSDRELNQLVANAMVLEPLLAPVQS